MTGSAFEKWQVVSGVIQNVLLLGTVLFAAYIGLKQTEIAAQQTLIIFKLKTWTAYRQRKANSQLTSMFIF